ncbi:mucin-2-like isoform X15 [Vanessa tameamea]|uniref:Mucin-2-like isoform X15 n=1 Tax=Vanessa tameamea TaxID=334116 RepID=A0ABM4AWP6_VANTA
MRGVWWSAFALLLLVVVTSAIRTAQVEGTSRISRRLPNPDRSPTSSNKSEDVSPTSRSRVSRRREEIQPRDISRSRSRSRPTESPSYTTIKSQNQPERSDRFDSRRSNSRVRSKPVVNEENFDTTVNRENQSKSRSRQSSRYVAAQSMPVPLLTTSPSIGKIQKDFTDIAFNDITKTLSKDVGELNSQIRRRSSTVRTIESVTVPRGRGRINTRTNVRALDLDVSGTANALSTAPKEPTTARTEDIRNSRKLRYKTRQSETDTNLTGEGIATSNEVKSSQIRENVTSQTESKSFSRSTTEKNLRSSTERISLKSSTLKTTKVVKRPVSRNKGKTPLTAQKNKVSDEIKEDDNYPEPFKALIQAKNASTQASSPPSESLSVKASQKVFKTHTTSSQSIITAPDIEKHSRLRSKINLEGNSSNSPIEENIPVIITTTSEQPKPKSVEYRLRGSFKPRSKKSNTLSTSTISTASFSPSVDRTYKFQRKVKLTTTEASNIGNSSQSKSNDTNISFKKPALRSSLYLRRNVSKTVSANSEIPIKIDPSKNNEGKSILKSKQLLPRTSYYSRLRNGGLSTTSTTDSSIQNTTEDISIAEKKVENTAELPIIYTDGTPKVSDNANKQESRNFIITVNSKESSENGTELNGNETISMTVENEKLINNFVSTTQKYHATYKDNNNDISTSSKEKSTVTPLIRNIRTRKYSRKSSKPREEISVVTSKSRERNSRKYSDTFSKTTEASSNGIIAGPEKQKNKFSSKYRASYLDKPFYKPTVPTITPSTVEGEEIQIGPDMNAISFTKSRSPLTSADLRLSESLAKSLQVMNVEASHHSPSVTVSIFDALAEILTSTPRPRISSTTEVLQKQSTNNDVKQINDGTKQIRTEKPDDGNGKTVFKFIPIDEVTVSPQESNVLKLASTKMPKTTTFNEMLQVTTSNSNTQTLQNDISTNGQTSSTPIFAMTSNESSDTTTIFPELSIVMNNIEAKPTTLTPEITTSTVNMAGSMFATANEISTPIPLTTPATTVTTETDNLSTETTTLLTTLQTTSFPSTAAITTPTANVLETAASNQKDAELLQSLLQQIGRSPKNLNNFSNNQQNDNAKLLQAILLGGPQNIANKKTSENKQSSTTIRSIEDDIRQFEEDTKLLKALLLATGRNPAELNLPNLDNTKKVTASTTSIPITTKLITTTDQPTTTQRTTTTIPTTTTTTTTTPTTTTTTTPTTTTTTTTSTTTNIPLITTTLKSTSSGRISELSYNEDLRKLQEDTRLLQALLQATGNQNTANIPIISGITSNVRIASNPLTTSIESNPTTPVNDRPIFTTRPSPVFTAITPETVTVSTLQPQQQTTEEIGISTTFQPFNVRSTTTVRSVGDVSTTTRRPKNSRFQVTTEMPSTSTFSDEEDLQFLQNLKSVLSAKNSGEDPETALANRVIALAVERSLNEIQTGKKVETSTTTYRPTTTTARLMTTTTKMTTTEASTLNTPSIEEDIKQFEQDTKLLQALLKATGQDPSKFNIPTLTNTNRPVTASIDSTTAKPYGPKIAVKDELKNEQDDAQLLQTLIKLQDAQETTTQRSKIAITGQSSDEALKKLLNQAQPAGMVSEATKSSISLSTEFGNSNDALLAALLKEQGFGPTTASSLDEQLRLAALLNQVVVTPKARRTTTPPPPPPAPRRPVLDGLAWLWQQWRETAPGPDVARPNRRPAPSARPSITPSAATSSRVNWFGSGPFVGNADERPTSNRIPLEPPSAVTTEQGPGRGQLVSAAINVTRAFSQFLGAAIQGAAQTVQSVIRAGQRAASDAYTNGSG